MKEIVNTEVKSKLKDVYLSITWSKIAHQYFGKSSSWLYNKMNGRDGNGGEGEFTAEEIEVLKKGLIDFAERILKCANSL